MHFCRLRFWSWDISYYPAIVANINKNKTKTNEINIYIVNPLYFKMDLDQGISPKPRKRKRDQIELLINSSQLIVTSGLSQLRYLILVDGLTTNPETV